MQQTTVKYVIQALLVRQRHPPAWDMPPGASKRRLLKNYSIYIAMAGEHGIIAGLNQQALVHILNIKNPCSQRDIEVWQRCSQPGGSNGFITPSAGMQCNNSLDKVAI
ncbi:hypothetical protein RE432_16940 [Pusillimonas sp. SM2304]|uniref:hypothetical protein n=1 Tax=Pusillimonas sp. SM2304 TaxID=3073241 RepID=UPI002874B4F8|nr:hypothetical protein [Pusillimonas sp. SM2304]MDS1142123.1 hypothetical protein [Pusillimonas sp. SM2304]